MSKLGCSLDAGKSFLGIMGLLWQAVSVTLVTCWSESTRFFFSPLLAGRFFSTLLLCKQWHFCSWRTLLRQPQFFSPLFFFTAIWWAKFFSFISLNRAFCKWLWASCCCHLQSWAYAEKSACRLQLCASAVCRLHIICVLLLAGWL